MVLITDSLAAATLVVGYDIFSATPFKEYATAKFKRRVQRVGIVGSTAAGDTELLLKYGADVIFANIFNTKTGSSVDQHEDMQLVVDRRECQADMPLSLIVQDAANTNACIIQVEIV